MFLTDLLGEGEGGLSTLPKDSVSSRHRERLSENPILDCDDEWERVCCLHFLTA